MTPLLERDGCEDYYLAYNQRTRLSCSTEYFMIVQHDLIITRDIVRVGHVTASSKNMKLTADLCATSCCASLKLTYQIRNIDKTYILNLNPNLVKFNRRYFS